MPDGAEADFTPGTLLVLTKLVGTGLTPLTVRVQTICATYDYAQYRGTLERLMHEYLDIWGILYDAEEFEDLMDLLAGELIDDAGSCDSTIDALSVIYRWGADQDIKIGGPDSFTLHLYRSEGMHQPVFVEPSESEEEEET